MDDDRWMRLRSNVMVMLVLVWVFEGLALLASGIPGSGVDPIRPLVLLCILPVAIWLVAPRKPVNEPR